MTDKLVKIAKWLAKHVKIASRDLNASQPREREEEREPHVAREIQLKWDF